jgi:hypothetical protein
MVNIEELIGTTEHMTLYTRCCLTRCRYNRVPLYLLCGLEMSRVKCGIWLRGSVALRIMADLTSDSGVCEFL